MESDAAKLDNATSVCDHILAKRVKQSTECKSELLDAVRTGAAMHAWLIRKSYYQPGAGSKKADDKPFQLWLNDVNSSFELVAKSTDAFMQKVHGQSVGDDDAAEELRQICADAGCEGGKAPKWDAEMQEVIDGTPALEDFKELKSSTGVAKTEENRLARIWSLRELVHRIRRLQKELIGRTRSQRCFRAVRDAQNGNIPDVAATSILTCCGHYGSTEAVGAAAKEFRCLVDTCRAPARPTNMVLASTLCVDSESGTFGAKLETLVNIVSTIPDTDRVLVFVQFDDLFIKVEEALRSYGIPVATLAGSAKQRS